jgi:lipopolysaccharide transport system permease protein
MPATLRALWQYRGFIAGSVKREFQMKYLNSLLGWLWTIIQPLAMIVVYTVIFSQVMKARLAGVDNTYAYSIYLCAGVLTWTFFGEIAGRAQNLFIDNGNLLKKLSFPKLCLPVILVLSASLNFGIIFSLFLLFLIFTDQFPGMVMLAFIPVMAIQVLLAIGIGMTLGVLNVFFRDVGQMFNVILQFWFWLTPVIYPASILPQGVKEFMAWNPMAPIIWSFQEIMVYGKYPDWSTLIYPLILALLFCYLGFRLFRKRSGEMVDEL